MATNLRSALSWDFLGNGVSQVLRLGITIVLARILSPEEFGVVGVALVFLSLTDALLDFGLSTSLIQKKVVSNLLLSSVFFVNIFAALVLGAIYLVSASFIGSFYEFESLGAVISWLTLLILFKSLSLVQSALLRKNLKFKELSIRQMVSSFVGGAVGIAMALLDYGVYSLVGQHLTTALINSALLWLASGWRPNLAFSFKELDEVRSFSFFIFIDNLVSMLFNRLDVLLVGKVFSASTVGYYTRATSLKDQLGRFSSLSLNRVFFPVLSALQDNSKEFDYQFKRIFSVCVFAGFYISAGLSLFGEELILGLFGDKWLQTVSIFSVLVLTAGNFPLNSMIINAIVSVGKAREHFVQGLIRKFIRLVPIPVALMYGLQPFVVTLTVIGFLMVMLNLVFLHKVQGIQIRVLLIQWLFWVTVSLGFILFVHAFAINNFGAKAMLYLLFTGGYLSLGYLRKDPGLQHIQVQVKRLLISRED